MSKSPASEAAQLAQLLSYRLLAASSPNVPPDGRKVALELAFTVWPSLCRRMSELEARAPGIAEAGAHQNQRVMDVAEHVARQQQAAE